MKRAPLLRSAALAALLLCATSARADLIQWGYRWEAIPTTVTAGSGLVELTPEIYRTARGSSDIVAANLHVQSSALPSSPDVFTPLDGNYQLRLHLTDVATSTTGYIDFFGQLQGRFSQSNSQVTNTFLAPSSQTVTVGSAVFDVSLVYYTPPGPPAQGNLGSIGGHVNVSANPDLDPASVPEPSSLALAGLGLGAAGLAAWKRRRQAGAA